MCGVRFVVPLPEPGKQFQEAGENWPETVGCPEIAAAAAGAIGLPSLFNSYLEHGPRGRRSPGIRAPIGPCTFLQ